MSGDETDIESIAIIGMSVRAPGASNYAEYWQNICNKVESVTRFDDDELHMSGVPRALLEDPAYVAASCILNDADHFDPDAFGFSQAEAALLDPQHRLFLESAWQALEDAGHDPYRFDGPIGVYGGMYMNKYLPLNLYTNDRFNRSAGAFFARNFNDKDFITGQVAYRLNLQGPAITVQTACSTSLVAVHLACQALLSHDCDMALAGGVAVNVPLKAGYLALEGTMFTPTGQCRPFDVDAQGTLPGNGAIIVALRRLSEAVAAGDTIRAVIRGTAINNDGAAKMSFTAPNPDAQARVIATAQAVAGVHPESVGYVEAHGTGTRLGDPIEVTSLTAAFRLRTERIGYCALGSVKANVGHLEAAAGAAGLARAVLALENKLIPPQINYRAPNPDLKLDASPFYVPVEPRPWTSGGTPRRAGVSAFAVGGTNAHVVLEEAPAQAARQPGPGRPHLIVVSAHSRDALARASVQLADRIEVTPPEALSDVAYTLACGRAELPVRRSVVGDDAAAIAASLRATPTSIASATPGEPRVIFMFPGVGTQYPDMTLDIYEAEPTFRDDIDRCATLLAPRLDMDIRSYLFTSRYPGSRVDWESVPHVLAAILTVEYALARLWMSWGVTPAGMLGHSLGEYAAACLSGVLTLEDALDLTVRRGRIFDRIPEGRMMGVPLSAEDVVPHLGETLSIGAINAPALTLVSGPQADLDQLSRHLVERGLQCRPLPIRMASHSRLVDPYLDEFETIVAGYRLSEPTIPFLSCLTGDWITSAEATAPRYWRSQLRSTVQFAKMVKQAVLMPNTILLEIGPGRTLTTLAGAQGVSPRPTAIATLRHPSSPAGDRECLVRAAGRVWEAGTKLDWPAMLGGGSPRRVPLPTYPFQRRRFWVDAGRTIGPGSSPADRPVLEAEDDRRPDQPIDPTTEHDRQGWSDRERAVADLWREELGAERVGLDDDFETLGGHSLLAAQMLRRLRSLTAGHLIITDLFAAPTVRQLAALMDERERHGGTAGLETVDLTAEVTLDDAIQAAAATPARQGPPREVLLTGATGFLGTYILAELLRQTDATVHCLVRAATASDGADKLMRNLRAIGYDIPDAKRLIVVPGDLQRPRLGMSEPAYRALAASLDAIYHCGAWVNFARPYTVLKKANVGGTQEVFALATTSRLKTVHHVSTMYVTMGAIMNGVERIDEDDPLPSATTRVTSRANGSQRDSAKSP